MSETYAKNIQLLAKKNAGLAVLVEQADKNDSCYGAAVTAKDGSHIASFVNGASVFSPYNPERDANLFAAQLPQGQKQFCLVGGLASAQHVTTLLRTASKIRVLAVEKNAASLKTLFSAFDLTALLELSSFFVAIPETLEESLCALYLPALYPRFVTLFLRSWSAQNEDAALKIKQSAERALKTIAADYSVQAHFGKIWMRNIIRNLQTASRLPDKIFSFPTEKTAHIIAAGPSLDQSLPQLKKKRQNAYIIATDTALQILLAFNIIPDAVVTIDGQNISYLHFFQGLPAGTLLVADLCAHPAAAKTAIEGGGELLFAQSSHPLCVYAAACHLLKTGTEPFLRLDVTSGTVTAAAADFAVKAGFSSIALHGADFAYHGGKPYARGAYLDTLYAADANRINTLEQHFTALMYRSRLTVVRSLDKNVVYTNETLQHYAAALSVFIQKSARQGIGFEQDIQAGILLPQVKPTRNCEKWKKNHINRYSYSFSAFICRFINSTEKDAEEGELLVALLPFAAWLQKTDRSGTENILRNAFYLAKSKLESYTKTDYDK